MGGGLVAPSLPIIGEAFNVAEERVGLILSVYTLAAAISLPMIGYFIDSIGRKKVGITCLLIDGSAGLAIMFAPTFSFLLLLRFIQGVGIAGLVPVAMTVIGDLSSGSKRLQLMGYLSGTISLGAIVIPFVGGTLASVHWRLVFAVYGFSLLLAMLFSFTFTETDSRAKGDNSVHNSPLNYTFSLLSTLKVKNIRNLIIHCLILYFLLYALVAYLPIYLIQIHGFDEIFSGIALSVQAVFSAILASKASSLAGYLDWKKRTGFGFILISLSFLTLPYWPSGSYMISLSFILYGSGMGIVSPTIYNQITLFSPSGLTGSVIAIFNTMKYVGMTIAPVMIGFSLIFTALDTVFIGVGVFSATWAVITLLPDLH